MSSYDRVDILLVEDSPHDAEMTQRALRRGGVSNDIFWVKDGVEALDYLFCQGTYADRGGGLPKLVLLDLKMPRMDGLQVLERLRAVERMDSLPIVILTSSQEESDLVKGYALGVNSYIVKPVDFEKFADTVAQVGLYWVLVNAAPG